MSIFDKDGVAPETGMPNFTMEEDSTDFLDDIEDDAEPIEHNDIRSTPVSMPDFKKSRTPNLQKELASWYTMVGTGIFPFDQQIGVTVIESADNCSAALYDLAQKNPSVKRALNNMLSAGAYGAVISAHLPIAVLVATKYIPPLRDSYGAAFDSFVKKNPAA